MSETQKLAILTFSLDSSQTPTHKQQGWILHISLRVSEWFRPKSTSKVIDFLKIMIPSLNNIQSANLFKEKLTFMKI